jgi:hypothetical protein
VPSKGASIKKEGGNWTDEGFRYIITAENGDTCSYSVVRSKVVPNRNSFEDWSSSKGYYVLSDLNWTSGNAGISTAFGMMEGNRDKTNPENYPTKRTSDSHEGKFAVSLETIEGGKVFGRSMPILSGNFFLGNFNTSKMTDPLSASEFGNLYLFKPKCVPGYSKYEEGTGNFINGEPGKNDSCDIYAAFYQAKDDSGKEIILTAKNAPLDESPYVLAYAHWPDCSTTGGEFRKFTLDFGDYKNPDFEKYSYKLIITFAASKGGATYEGKIGSKLTIDEVEIEDY